MSWIDKFLDILENWKYPEDKEMKKRIEKIKEVKSPSKKSVKVPPLQQMEN